MLVRSGRDDDPPPCLALIADTRSALRIPDTPGIPMELASDLSSGSNIVEMLPDLRVFWVVSVTEQTFPRRRCHTYIHRWVYAFAHIVHVNGYGCDCVLLEANGKYPDKKLGGPLTSAFAGEIRIKRFRSNSTVSPQAQVRLHHRLIRSTQIAQQPNDHESSATIRVPSRSMPRMSVVNRAPAMAST